MTSGPVSRRRALGGLVGLLAAGSAATVAAVRGLTSPAPRARVAAGTVREIDRYGELPRQDGEWWLPPGAGTRAGEQLPTVVLVHGGYWRPQYDRTLEDAVAADLAGRGYLVWNVDYAAADQPWPRTLTDVALGYDHLVRGRHARLVDPRRVAVVGHSAGGQLALWLAARSRLSAGTAGTPVRGPRPALAVGQAPVAALARAARENLGGGAVALLLGGSPTQVPDRYAVADPTALLPTGLPTVCVHGTADDIVPLSQSEVYVAQARAAGDDATLVRVPGGHFTHLDPGSAAIQALREALARLSA